MQSGLPGAQALSLDPPRPEEPAAPGTEQNRTSLQPQNCLLLSWPVQGEAGVSWSCLTCRPVSLTPPEEHVGPFQKW